MAAYEILLLNTAIPQIQAAQSGDTYLVPRDIAINATAIISANSATDALRITQTGAGNALLVEDSANPDSTPFVVTATGDVGIGTSSPAVKLQVNGSGQILRVTDGTTGASIYSGSGLFGFNNQTGEDGMFGSTSSHYLYFATNGAEKMRLDSSGNLGLGVTPSAWWSGMKALQVGSGAALYDFGSSNVALGSNLYFDGTNSRYINTDFASYYQQNNGIHIWATAPSGTANSASVTSGASYTVVALGSSTLAQWQAFFNDSSNNPLTVTPTIGQVLTGNATGTLLGGGLVTQNISFTQAMTLDASGNLIVGNTAPAGSSQITAYGASNGQIAVQNSTNWSRMLQNSSDLYIDNGVGGSAGNIIFRNSSSTVERARITSGGVFVIKSDGSNASNLANKRTTSVGTGATTISLVATSYGQLVMVTGIDGGNIFSDLIFTSITAGPTVISAKSVSGTPASRTYTMSGDDLQLAMGSGSYDVRCTQFTNL